MTELRVSEEDIDDLGHVNNARFVEYFERGRRAWYAAAGLPAADASVGTVLVRLEVDFARECFAGERLRVRTAPESRGRRSYVFAQRIEDGDGRTVAAARATSVAMDLVARRTVPVPESIASRFPAPGAGRAG